MAEVRLYLKSFGILTLGEISHHVRSVTTLTLLCCEEAQTSYMEREREKKAYVCVCILIYIIYIFIYTLIYTYINIYTLTTKASRCVCIY